MKANEPDFDDMYDDDYYDNQPYESCPKCGRAYDHIDFDFQNCSKCGWDAEKEKWGESREPEQEDYEMGDADILTGRWN
jgi:ribosomal protein L37E